MVFLSELHRITSGMVTFLLQAESRRPAEQSAIRQQSVNDLEAGGMFPGHGPYRDLYCADYALKKKSPKAVENVSTMKLLTQPMGDWPLVFQ